MVVVVFGEVITYALLARAIDGEKDKMEKTKEHVETGLSNRIQPWQAIFALLSYAIGVYGIEDEKALILYGLILATLGFVMVSTNKHQEAIKQVIAPWLVEQVLTILGDFLEPTLPESPTEEPPEPIAEPDKEKVIAELREAIATLDKEMKE